jgi:hypothetical protein
MVAQCTNCICMYSIKARDILCIENNRGRRKITDILVDEGNDYLAVDRVTILPVLAIKLVFVVTVLTGCPDEHLKGTGAHEEEASNCAGHEIEPDPGENFIRVVGTGDVVEKTAGRNSAQAGAGGAQRAKGQVAAEIADFHEVEHDHACIREVLRGWSVERVVDKVGHEGSKAPVIRAVLKDVCDGHCGMRKPVHKQSLDFALRVMERPRNEGRQLDLLGPRGLHGADCIAINPSGLRVEQRIEEERAEILNDEYSLPQNLWTKVLEQEALTIGKRVVVFKRDRTSASLFRWPIQPLAVCIIFRMHFVDRRVQISRCRPRLKVILAE